MRLIWIAMFATAMSFVADSAASASVRINEIAATTCASSQWENRRCRCVRSDKRGCVQWQCRRAPVTR